MNRNDTIDTGTFTLQREHVLAVMQDQRDASAQVIDDKTGLWRKVRIASVIAMVPLFLVGITLKQAPWMQIAFVAFFVLGIIFKVSSWLIKRGMNRLGTSGTVSRNTVVKALDRRIFKGREASRRRPVSARINSNWFRTRSAFRPPMAMKRRSASSSSARACCRSRPETPAACRM